MLSDRITVALAGSSDAQPDLVGALINAAACRGLRRSRLYYMVVELVEDGVERGERTSRHEPQLLADIIVGALIGAIPGWVIDPTDQLTKKMHNLGVALADCWPGLRRLIRLCLNHHHHLALTPELCPAFEVFLQTRRGWQR
jgi:hypothetical protein